MKFVEESSWKWKQVVRLLLKNKPVFSSLSVPPNIQELFVVVDNGRKSLFHLKCGKFELLCIAVTFLRSESRMKFNLFIYYLLLTIFPM